MFSFHDAQYPCKRVHDTIHCYFQTPLKLVKNEEVIVDIPLDITIDLKSRGTLNIQSIDPLIKLHPLIILASCKPLRLLATAINDVKITEGKPLCILRFIE